VALTTIERKTLSVPSWKLPPSTCHPDNFDSAHWAVITMLASLDQTDSLLSAHDNLSCNSVRHPFLLTAGVRSSTDPHPGKIVDRDDYDCIDDLVSAGLVEVIMPTPDVTADCFVSPTGEICAIDDVVLRPSFATTMCDILLARWATFALSAAGRQVAYYLSR
jgi:hypothetical protein